MKTTERQSNIELLRILAMIGVVLMHYIASPGQLLANEVPAP